MCRVRREEAVAVRGAARLGRRDSCYPQDLESLVTREVVLPSAASPLRLHVATGQLTARTQREDSIVLCDGREDSIVLSWDRSA